MRIVVGGGCMETSDWGLARTIEAQVLASHARQIAAEIRFVEARHSQIAGGSARTAPLPR